MMNAPLFLSLWMWLPLTLLAMGVASVWTPSLLSSSGWRLPAWAWFYAALVASAALVSWHAGVPRPAAFGALVLLPLAAAWQQRPSVGSSLRRVLKGATVALCFAMALRLWPGFPDVVWVSGLSLGEGAAAYRLTAALDAGVAGLFMLALYARRCTDAAAWRSLLRPTVQAALCTTVVVLGLAMLLGYLRFDPKWPWFAWLHLLKILFWTCVVEECFFRGILLEALLQRGWRWGGIVLTSVLFGMAHARGGWALVLLASVAGLGYGWAYAATRRIESAMAVHWVVNATHFLCFTYPRLQASGA